ncbi:MULTISPECIES: hypothetical protein [unclassified Corallococcus]|uniref:hypothetical protein n=1 Tax=unclassified Corallococcus TaxID=2685029 RepID=UPI001A8DD21D|nr:MULTISPECIES: hypothetical protein [unclassified Corallococcus]MBN9685638.1 hypothetical protein [Corallococcus sp. NCSPR001]WAS82916.1 hypothetical protein O0N60_26755 [Corallococcus sp. NCRR]
MDGRFTLKGSAEVEARIAQVVGEAANVVDWHVPRSALRTLALMGGYGRGEGGVDRRDGAERPHNNLDFLLVLERAPRAELKAELDAALEPLRERHGLGLDLGIITARALRRSPCLVMWYDMRFGHKTVAGDASFLPGLKHFTRDAILPDDIRNLAVNRGTLLVINEALRDQGSLGGEARRTILRHTAKAIIGYGDALLYFLGAYDWSYVEKRRRMAGRRDVPDGFRRLYDEASAFRLEPDDTRFAGRELGPWMDEVRARLADVHLVCEAARLSVPGLSWDGYVERTLKHSLREGGLRPGVLLRRARNAVRFRPEVSPELGLRARLGLRLGGPRGVLAAAFPFVAFGVGETEGAGFARTVLGAASSSPADLRHAYLRFWSESGDPNFTHVARKLGLVLEAGS